MIIRIDFFHGRVDFFSLISLLLLKNIFSIRVVWHNLSDICKNLKFYRKDLYSLDIVNTWWLFVGWYPALVWDCMGGTTRWGLNTWPSCGIGVFRVHPLCLCIDQGEHCGAGPVNLPVVARWRHIIFLF